MSIKENGKGAMAWAVILTLLLAGANVIGGYIWSSVNKSTAEIADLKKEVALNRQERDSQVKELREAIIAASRNRWTATHMRIWSGEFERLNTTSRLPDVRRIVQEGDP